MTANSHDDDLPLALVRKRKRLRSAAHWILLAAFLVAIPGWIFFVRSLHEAMTARPDEPSLMLVGWAFLVLSGIGLLTGLWYLLQAHVRRIARMVGVEALAPDSDILRCGNCGWPHDSPDRFCRHCGKPLSNLPAPATMPGIKRGTPE